jgi:hypothetical protein
MIKYMAGNELRLRRTAEQRLINIIRAGSMGNCFIRRLDEETDDVHPCIVLEYTDGSYHAYGVVYLKSDSEPVSEVVRASLIEAATEGVRNYFGTDTVYETQQPSWIAIVMRDEDHSHPITDVHWGELPPIMKVWNLPKEDCCAIEKARDMVEVGRLICIDRMYNLAQIARAQYLERNAPNVPVPVQVAEAIVP